LANIESQPSWKLCANCVTRWERENTFFVHVTWLPFIGATQELKPNPPSTQCPPCVPSVSLQNDHMHVPITRSEDELCRPRSPFSAMWTGARWYPNGYCRCTLTEVPLLLEKAGRGAITSSERWGLQAPRDTGLGAMEAAGGGSSQAQAGCQYRPGGKYVELKDAYMSVREAVKHAALSWEWKPKSMGAFRRPRERQRLG